jgi:hypothetical protein
VTEWARQLGDQVALVANTPGSAGRKTGDYLVTLGDATGAPGLKVVIEVKNRPYTITQARAELQRAKKTRQAVCGIFAFAKGCEPPEVADFHRIGEDFYCTIDRDLLAAGSDLLYFEAAYKIARAQAVTAVCKEATGRLDLQRIRGHIDYLTQSVKVIADLAAKARVIRKNGGTIEDALSRLKGDLEGCLKEMLDHLHVQPTA